MRIHALFAAAALAAAAPAAFAQSGGPGSWNGPPRECWNPRAGQFEGVRENEYQNDLDYSQCRLQGGGYAYGYGPGYGSNYVAPRYYDERAYPSVRRECWNPRARTFESVREGEYQNDLDFSRCRVVREAYVDPAPRRYYYYGR